MLKLYRNTRKRIYQKLTSMNIPEKEKSQLIKYCTSISNMGSGTSRIAKGIIHEAYLAGKKGKKAYNYIFKKTEKEVQERQEAKNIANIFQEPFGI